MKSISTALVMGVVSSLFFVSKATADTTVCAKVNMSISQEATLEREAFDAALGITNEFPSYGLEDFRVDVVIKDASGNDASALFYVKVNSKENITAVDGTGVVQPATTANVHWLIIPSTGAGGTSAAGFKYSVRADISYKLNGVYQNVSTYDDYITVKPQPAIKLEYVLPFEVFGDEPLTTDVTEAVEPFPLGVRVTNVGYGAAKNFTINSGEPDIRDNAQGLAVNVSLVGTYLGSTKISNTLLVPFGDVAAGGVSQAAWVMSASLSGRFQKFTASFTHSDELGGAQTSLIQDVTTYTLIKDVLVDVSGSDSQFDFLVNTTFPRDAMYTVLAAGQDITPEYILESSQASPIPVSAVGGVLSGALGGASTAVTLRLSGTVPTGWVYASVPAPLEGKARLLSVVRSDGKVINARNAWISKHFNKETRTYLYRFAILDYNTSADYTYTLNFSLDSVDTAPAAVTDLAISTVNYSVQSAQAGLTWSSTGEDGASGTIYGGRYLIQTATNPAADFSTAAAQISFSTNTSAGAIQNYLLSSLAGNASYYMRLWVQDTSGNISQGSNLAQLYLPPNPPASGLATLVSSSAVNVAWAGGNNNLPISYALWLATSAMTGAIAPADVAAGSSYTFAGLTPNTTYFLYGRASNPDSGAISADAYLASTITLAAQPGAPATTTVFLSSAVITWPSGGNPEGTEFAAELSTASDWSVLTASTDWNSGLTASFAGLAENTTYYARAKARNCAGVETAYTDLGALKTGFVDVLAPVTELFFQGAHAGAELVYVASSTAIGLSAYDDAYQAGDRLGGAAMSYYSVDSDTFAVYGGTFSLTGENVHALRYYSVDKAGNTEVVKVSSAVVDASAPVTTFAVEGSSVIVDGTLYLAAASSVTLSASDVMSGVARLDYSVDGTTAAATSQVQLQAGPGGHELKFSAVDNVENTELERAVTFYVDADAPVSSVSVEGVYTQGGYLGGVIVALSAVDAMSGVAGINYSLDGSSYAVYAGTFPVIEVGTHTLVFRAEDKLGNIEVEQTFNIQISSYITVPEFSMAPASGPIGVPFTIGGAGFGTYSSGITTVLIGDATAPLTLWSTTTIKGTIPGSLAAGEYPVSVMRGTTTLALASSFTVTTPVLYGLTPSSGAIGIPFTVTGESFGNYISSKTQVLIGGTTAALTLWTDTKIQGTIPGTLAVGDYDLVVERAINGGVVRTSSATFSLRGMEAWWLAPSSGPIGMPFTITGAGFGNYSSAYTHVLVGDTTAPLTLWTDGKIQGTVPGGLSAGQYPVIVERLTADGGQMRTSSMTFEVVTVDVASMTPVAGPIGLPFTVYGSGFGNYVSGKTRVLLGGTTAPLTLWTDSKIQGTVPGSLAAGDYELVVERELNSGIVRSSVLAFKVSTPAVYGITPSSGPIGAPFTITGENFGNYLSAYTGVLMNGATVPLTLWTDGKIQGTIPGGLTPGQYPVTVFRKTADGGAVQTETLTFEVVGVSVASMTPVAGPIGLPFTIYGGNFGNYSSGNTKVLLGDTTCPLTLWTDTKIQGTVPGSLTDGDYPVTVVRSLNGGVVQSSTLTFTVASPVAYTLSPSSGPIGLPFTITGDNFGNYVSGYTRVLIGGTTAPLTLWSTTTIKGTIPALAAGDYELYVERAINNGVVRTSTFAFTVADPALVSVSPATAAVVAAFTLGGYNFGNYSSGYSRVLINGATTTLTLWTDIKVQGKLPAALGAGTYPVQVQRAFNGGLAESVTAYISVEEPMISSMTPVSGAVGAVFNLYGTAFGAYDSTIAKVFIGGTQSTLTLWSDTRITGTIPSGLTYGTHTVVAVRGQFQSNALTLNIPGGYTASMYKNYSPLSLEFKLGEVYVYPDPAKGGKVPTFHVEVGQADSVRLKVYTVSGELVHERTLTGVPQAVGSTYAYEYPWEGRIASGVYYYTMEAERDGKKLKARGKFSVVR